MNKLSDKEFQKILSLQNEIAKTFRHRYSIHYDTGQSYLLDIFAENKEQFIELFKTDIGKFKNDLTEKLRQRLKIQRVTLKDPLLHKYKLNVVIESLQPIGKYDILGTLLDEVNKVFSVEYSKIRDSKSENKKILYEIDIGGKPSRDYLNEDDLYMVIEKYINNTKIVKVTSLGIQINKRARVSIDSLLTSIDFSDDLIEPDCKKELFYKYIDEFDLTSNEETFINLTFKGYDVNSDEDFVTFQEAIKGKNDVLVSKKYIRKSFFDRLCKKLTSNSPFID